MTIHNITGALYIAYAVKSNALTSDNFIFSTIIDEYITKHRPSKKVLNHIKRK